MQCHPFHERLKNQHVIFLVSLALFQFIPFLSYAFFILAGVTLEVEELNALFLLWEFLFLVLTMIVWLKSFVNAFWLELDWEAGALVSSIPSLISASVKRSVSSACVSFANRQPSSFLWKEWSCQKWDHLYQILLNLHSSYYLEISMDVCVNLPWLFYHHS